MMISKALFYWLNRILNASFTQWTTMRFHWKIKKIYEGKQTYICIKIAVFLTHIHNKKMQGRLRI